MNAFAKYIVFYYEIIKIRLVFVHSSLQVFLY